MLCSQVEALVFPSRALGRRGSGHVVQETKNSGAVDREVEGGKGGKQGEDQAEEDEEKDKIRDREGRQRAEWRERVRRVARRAVREGLPVQNPIDSASALTSALVAEKEKEGEGEHKWDGEQRCLREVEAVGKGGARLGVDVSFAKGEWGLRWKV